MDRAHLADTCASLWIDGELIHFEDLVLHDATKDIRTPTHELTIARDVLKTCRRVATDPPAWVLSFQQDQNDHVSLLTTSRTDPDHVFQGAVI